MSIFREDLILISLIFHIPTSPGFRIFGPGERKMELVRSLRRGRGVPGRPPALLRRFGGAAG